MSRPLNKVLIVDDDPLILQLLEIYLRADGYEVLSASNGCDALQLAEQHQPSYLITDWNMPELTGLELCRRVRQLDLPGYIYIVFVTARSETEDLLKAMAAGADDFLIKPLHKHELMARLSAGARILNLESKLSQLAAHDPLTELPTRRAFGEYLLKEWERSRRKQLPLSAVMLDVDYFKQVNDRDGHPAGDEVIRSVARLLRAHSRKSDVVCRYGGDEFCVLLPETDELSATIWAERLRSELARATILIGSTRVQVTVSLGVMQMLAEMEDTDELLSLVDQCLMAAKEQGRNRVVAFRTMADDRVVGDSGRSAAGGLEHVLARDAMIPLFHSLRGDWSAARAASYFLENRVSSAPVTSDRGELLGIVSEKDLLSMVQVPGAAERRVDQIMRPNVIVYEDSTPLMQIVSFLTRASMRSVIITAAGKPCGLISCAAVVRWFLENRWKPAPSVDEPTWDGDAVLDANDDAETGVQIEPLTRQIAQLAGP